LRILPGGRATACLHHERCLEALAADRAATVSAESPSGAGTAGDAASRGRPAPQPPGDDGAAGPLLTAAGLAVSFPVGGQLMARMRHTERLLRAVDGVDLEVRRGEALALVGSPAPGSPPWPWPWPGCGRPTGARSGSAAGCCRPGGRATTGGVSRWSSRTRTPRSTPG